MTIEEWLGNNNQIGIDIWNKKYKYMNETFDEWLNRVSGNDNKLKQLILEKKFLFGGRILSNRGLQHEGKKISFSNCYVIKQPEDNIESIFKCASELARTYSYGGGCGVDISNLSPRGAKIHNAAKETTGSVSFMELYSLVTELIGQSGRRGALMISIDCHHPDLEEFIEIKSDLNKITKANISIRVTNDFMDAIVNNKEFKLSFTREETGEKIEKSVSANELFRKICKNNWDMAEPGFLFWDNIKEWNLLSNNEEFEYAGVNPCAEEPLPAGGSCLLGSINLSEFVKTPFASDATFDFDDFKNTVKISVAALNTVLDEGLPLHPLQDQCNSVRDWRQIGLGVMGISDMLIKLSLRYGSQESINLCDKIAFIMADTAIRTSARLAKEYGKFPKCNPSEIILTPFFITNTSQKTLELVREYGLRNSQLLTIAPTGTLSTMLGISGGIEPVFANYYTRKTQSLHGKDVCYKVYTPIVEDYMKSHNVEDDTKLPEWFVTAQTINFKERIKMQAIWQKHIDASISSTVNVPNDFSVEDVEKLYLEAWKNKLKGITIYRDGCKRSGVLTTENSTNKNKTAAQLKRGDIIQVNDDVIGKKRKLITGCGSLHCTAFFDPVTGELQETYLSKGSAGGCEKFMTGLSRMISLSARSGCDIMSIVDQLNSCGSCSSYAVRTATKHDTSKGACCPIAVGNALLEMWKEIQDELGNSEMDIYISSVQNPCPQCGDELAFEGGCNVCKSCGWSKCS